MTLYDQLYEKLAIELSRPEVIRIIEEFEGESVMKTFANDTIELPDSFKAQQNIFLNSLMQMINAAKDGIIPNPYEETGSYLRTLDTGEYMEPEVANSLKTVCEKGQALYDTCCNDRINKCTFPLSDIISKP